MDPYRLPRHVVPVRYDLRLEPDLETCTYAGEETVTVTVTEPTTEIVLNAAELTLGEVTISDGGGITRRGTATVDADAERCRLRFDEPVTPGTWRLRLVFAGTLNDKLRGFYRSTYRDASGATRTMAATQFEATDARRAFPCWDEPDFKAVFAATLVVDASLVAISNTPIVSERVEGRRKIVTFADTITMSTYLLAFVVGPLEASEPILVGAVPLRVWALPGKQRLARFAQQIGAFSLRFFEDYYGLPYPGDKLDLLAIPDFAAGAMENLGAITFRETALLVDERQATHLELERIADVVAHENAHMWFGDLVTMQWWNGIWLNEAFATFMEMLAVDAWKPEWHRWTSFGASRAAALSIDGLWHTRPVEYPVRAPRDADAMFDVLTYEKGASVLRMLEQHLGPEIFRAGVRDYLRAHLYGNADTRDLWMALGRASAAPIPGIMDGWILAPGYPLVTARRDGAALVLSQQRFTYLPTPAAVPSRPGMTPPEAPESQRWQIPVQVRLAGRDGSVTHRLLLAGEETRLPLPDGFHSALVNEGGHGFYRVRYADDLREALLQRLDALQPIERYNLVNDAWAATLGGLLPLTDYLELITRFHAERDRNVWSVIVGSLYTVNRLVRPEHRDHLEAFVRNLLAPAVAGLGWAPRDGESELTHQLRGDLLRALGTLGNDRTVQTRAAELYEAALVDPTAVDANVLPALIGILAHAGDAARYAAFLERFRAASTPQEEQRYLYALTGFQAADLLAQTLERSINGEIRTQDAPFVNRSLLLSVPAREQAWEFVKAHWDVMDRRYPKHGLRRMCEGVVGLVTPELERDVHDFVARLGLELGGKTLDQYLEQLRVAVRLRERDGAAVGTYLGRFA